MEIIYKHDKSRNISPDFFSIHTHAMCEIFFLLKGSGFFVVEGHKYPLAPGSLLLLRAGEMHRAEIDAGCEYERCFLHFPEEAVLSLDRSGALLRPFSDRPLGQRNFYGTGQTDTVFIKELLLKCDRMLADRSADRDCLVHSLYFILKELEASFRQKRFVDNARAGYDPQIYDVIQYINRNLCSEQSLHEIEKTFFLSRPALNKHFRSATGTTVWDYIITKRVVLADQLMAEGKSATEAAFACGYNDYSSFYRAYRRVFGQSPRKKGGRP